MTVTIDEKTERDILAEAHKKIGQWFEVFGQNIQKGNQDRQFVYESQWTESESTQLENLNKPEIQINKVYDAIRKITGQQRAVDPQIKVLSKDFVSSDDDAELIANQKKIDLLQNLIRTISYDTQAKIAYARAFESALTSGFGILHVKTDYVGDKSFDQRPYIDYLPFDMGFFDITATDVTKSNGEYCGYYQRLTKDEFERQYPNVPLQENSFPTFENQATFRWFNKEGITLVYYYRKEYKKRVLYKLSDNTTMYATEYNEKLEAIHTAEMEISDELGIDEINAKILPDIIDKRTVNDYRIKVYKLIGNKVLDMWDWPSKEMPLAFIDGDSYEIKGLQYTQSFVYHVRDVQRFMNYCAVEIADALQKGRRETWLATPEMVQGFENVWKYPDNVQGYLPYNKQREGSTPTKTTASEIPASLMSTYQQLSVDIQQVMGVYNAGVGGHDPGVTSGVAISNQIRQGSVASYIYQDNLMRGIERIGHVVMSLIPKLYDTTRDLILTQQDGTQTQDRINDPREDGTVYNDLTKGDYHVMIEAGPSYELQKREYLQMLINLISTNPQIFPLVADLVADNIDIGNRQLLVERLKTLVPQDVQDKEAGRVPAPASPPPPNPELQLQQARLAGEAQDRQMKFEEMKAKNASDAQERVLKQQALHLDAIKLATSTQDTRMKVATDIGKTHAEVHKTNMTYAADLAKVIADTAKPHGESRH